MRWVESFLQGLRGYGFSPQVSVAVYRSFATFLLGTLLLEAGTLGDLTVTEMVDRAFVETDDLSSYPNIFEMSAELEGGGFETGFEAALEDLIERVALLRTYASSEELIWRGRRRDRSKVSSASPCPS